MQQFTVKTVLSPVPRAVWIIAVFLLVSTGAVLWRDTLVTIVRTWRLVPERASFTELYFIERPHLDGVGGRAIRYSYKLVSHEHEPATYHLVSYLEREDRLMERDDAVTLSPGEQRSYEVSVAVSEPFATTTIVVALLDRAQELRFRVVP